MKRVNFQEIYIQNFLSVGNPGITFQFNEGINLITGINVDKDSRNGVGKSTIIESLYWCLFGETMREIKKEQVVNNINKKDCLVSLQFTIVTNSEINRYTILREAKPSKVCIYENDVDITKSTIAKADDFIAKLISSTSDVFQNAVIMTANNTLPFMAQRKGDKRKFIEEMLRLSIFGDMSVCLRNDFADVKKTYELAFDRSQNITKNIKLYQEQQDKQSKNKEQKIEELDKKIANYIAEKLSIESKMHVIDQHTLNVLEQQIKTLPATVAEEKKKNKTYSKAAHELEFQVKQKTKELSDIDVSDDTCHTCNRKYDETHLHDLATKKQNLSAEISELKRKHTAIQTIITKHNSTLEKLEQELYKAKDDSHKIKMQINDNENDTKKIHQINLWVEHLEKDKLSTSNEESNFVSLIEQSQTELQQVEVDVKTNQHKMRVLDNARFVISEEGVKSFIIKKMLSLLNNKLNFYLNKLEAPCKCFFNEYFEEIIINEKGQECSYFNFSGGERKRIDIAVLFMFQDIRRLQSDVAINLSMYDELFDSALDERGAECILALLRERVEQNNESIYIVSHNKNTVKSGINNTIQLEKRDGFTKLIV